MRPNSLAIGAALLLGACSGDGRAVPSFRQAPVDESLSRVRFLDAAEAGQVIVDDGAEPYFALLSPLEITVKTGRPIEARGLEPLRDECRKRYREATLDFTDDEKRRIREVVANLDAAVSESYPRYAAVPWVFIRVASSLEMGEPFTRGAAIVLPHLVLANTLWLAERSAAARSKFHALLLHEKLHVLQRSEPRRFDSLYTEVMGFERAPTISTVPGLESRRVVNPDATDLGWVFALGRGDERRYYWPRLIFAPEVPVPRSFDDARRVGVRLERSEVGGFRVDVDAAGRPETESLRGLPQYREQTYGAYDTSHPAEIAAGLFNEIVMLEHPALADDRRGRGAARLVELEPLRRWFRQNLGGPIPPQR